jgi:DNA-binding transcriptional regulator YiaG
VTEPNIPQLLRALAEQAERAELRPIVKAHPDRIDSLRAEVHLDFVRACDKLEQQGLSHSDIARYFGVSRQTVSDWYRFGSHQRKQLQAYTLRGVEKMLVEALCGMVSNG